MIKKTRVLFARFQMKLMLAFLLCTLLPLSVIAFVSYGVSYSIAKDKILDSAVLVADQLHAQLSARIRQAENVADALQYSMYTLQFAKEQELSSYLEAFTVMRNHISLYKSTFDFYHICVYLQDDQFGSSEGLYFYPLSEMDSFSLSSEDLKNLGASSLWLYRPQIQLPFILNTEGDKKDSIICCRALHNQGSGQMDYAYFILMDTAEFSEILADAYANTEIYSYLITPDGVPAAVSRQELYGKTLSPDSLERLSQPTQDCYLEGGVYLHVLTLDNGWYQVTEIPTSYIADGTKVLLRTILFTLLLTLPLTVVTILLISRSLSRRIHILSGAMEAFRLRPVSQTAQRLVIPRPKDPDLYDEIDSLGLTFEQMLSTIQQNLKSILDLSLTEERLKYQLLQSQINPHFLYNILGSIKTCQSLGKLDVASQMITDLTRFYRLTLRKSGELIALRDEIEIASLYLNMEKLCHNNNLEWEMELEDGIENFMICKFTLQPFLENCILHGFSARTPELHIRVLASYGDDTVILRIQDDGAGIPANRLYELKQKLRNKTVSYEKHFGICNVNARISSELYGNGHIEIESELFRGTCITIEFAQLEGDEAL